MNLCRLRTGLLREVRLPEESKGKQARVPPMTCTTASFKDGQMVSHSEVGVGFFLGSSFSAACLAGVSLVVWDS